MLGDAYIARRDATTTPMNQALRHLSEEFPYASLWTRDVITRRERSMVTIGMLVAMSQHHELRGHLVGALNNGCTPEEIAVSILAEWLMVRQGGTGSALRLDEQLFEKAAGRGASA